MSTAHVFGAKGISCGQGADGWSEGRWRKADIYFRVRGQSSCSTHTMVSLAKERMGTGADIPSAHGSDYKCVHVHDVQDGSGESEVYGT